MVIQKRLYAKLGSFLTVAGIVTGFVAAQIGPLLGGAQPVRAIEPDGFACDGTFYQSRYIVGDGTYLYRINRDSTPYTTTQIGGAFTPGSGNGAGGNALGFDPTTGYLHLWRYGVNDFLTINNTGAIINTQHVSGHVTPTMQSATFDGTGLYYAMNGNANSSEYYTLSPSNADATFTTHSLTFTDPHILRGESNDIAIDPTNPNLMYLHTNTLGATGNEPYVSVIDLAAGTSTVIGISQTSGGQRVSFGTTMFDSAGSLYGYSNDGGFYQINKQNGTVTLINTSTPATLSDGASCAFADPSIDAIKSFTSLFVASTTQFRVTYTVGVKNTTLTGPIPNVQITEDLSRTFVAGSPSVSMYSVPTLVSGPCTINTSFNGISNTNLFNGSDSLGIGQSCLAQFTVALSYPSIGAVPTTPIYNSVYGSSTSHTPNTGYTFNSSGDPTPPPSVLTGEQSTNTTIFPNTSHGDTPSETPVNLPTSPSARGFESVHSTDTNGNGVLDAGDRLAYTITYENTGNANLTDFQITNTLPAGVHLQPGSVAVQTQGSGQTATLNNGFNGSSDTSLLSGGTTLITNGKIIITFNVIIENGFTGTIVNQATGTATQLGGPVLSDAVDSSTSGTCQAPSGITVPGSSIAQSCTVGLDPVSVVVVATPEAPASTTHDSLADTGQSPMVLLIAGITLLGGSGLLASRLVRR